MNIPLVLFFTLFAIIAKSEQKYVIPEVTIKVLKPKGLIVSIPDSESVQQFAFHANINQEIKGKEDGTISRDSSFAENGIWEIRDPNVQLKIGDQLSYWVFVQHKRLGYDGQPQTYKVTELIDENNIADARPAQCNPSITEVNGEKMCTNQKIFEDTFDNFNEDKWLKEQYVAWKPDYEFNTYETHPENNYISKGNVVFKATLRKDIYADVDLSNGCTRTTCQLQTNIIPPVIGARMRSKFSFKYGKIEIRALLPRGDWLYPIINLEPKDDAYGEGYNSGKIWLAFARGNRDLKTAETGENIGNNLLYMGPSLSLDEPQRTYKAHKLTRKNGQLWGNEYHTFTVLWQPDRIQVSVDNSETRDLKPPYAYPGGQYTNLWPSTTDAPFDKEFVISLGIAAGSISNFPDGSTSNGIKKPWKRTDSKAPIKFYNARDNWFNSWNGDNSAVKIDYVRVWAI